VSFDLILPYLRPIASLVRDPNVSEIMVNGPGAVFIERDGVLSRVEEVVLEERHLQTAVKAIARLLGDDVSEDRPILDARLPDGSRVAAVLPPCSLGGTTLAIRRFQRQWSCEALIQAGTITDESVRIVRDALGQRQNVLISGGTGSGKTTLLNALMALIPGDERIVVIEDTAELICERPNIVRLEAKRDQPGVPAVTVRDLLKASLRLRPDRIVVGEVRGGEAFDLLQALNSGHGGSLSTLHANSAAAALERLASCVVQCGIDLPFVAVRRAIGEAIDLVVHIERCRGTRVVTEVQRVSGFDSAEGIFSVAPIAMSIACPGGEGTPSHRRTDHGR
jgi:pilus assembly protein CpaF